jgi:hypothetical protein
MIEMIGEFIALLMGKIKKGDLREARIHLDNAYEEFLRKDAAFFQKIPEEKLTESLLRKHNFTDGHLEILSKLFYAEGLIAEAEKDGKRACDYYTKSLLLMEFVVKESQTFSLEKESEIAGLKEKISLLSS